MTFKIMPRFWFSKNILCYYVVMCSFSLNMAHANDGAYFSSGGIFYPLKETRVSIKKEILSFSCTKGVSQVHVYFEFFNPEKDAIKIPIGFLAPLPNGDVSEEDFVKKRIRNFHVQLGEEILPYRIMGAECSDCELVDISKLKFDQGGDGKIVYLFDATFEPGINKISHSYEFTASSSVVYAEQYNYVVSTASKWAGGKIDDFTLEIEMGDDLYVNVADIFGENAMWSVIGTGKIANKKHTKLTDNSRMVRLKSGKLIINATNFSPSKEFHFGQIRKGSYCYLEMDANGGEEKVKRALCNRTLVKTPNHYSEQEIRLIRNGIYAEHGYCFKSPVLTDYFKNQGWYLPDPNIDLAQILLSDVDKEFIEQVKIIEQNIKK